MDSVSSEWNDKWQKYFSLLIIQDNGIFLQISLGFKIYR